MQLDMEPISEMCCLFYSINIPPKIFSIYNNTKQREAVNHHIWGAEPEKVKR